MISIHLKWQKWDRVYGRNKRIEMYMFKYKPWKQQKEDLIQKEVVV